MIKRICDCCQKDIPEIFRESEIFLRTGYIAITVGRAELCSECVVKIVADEKHPMRKQ